MTTEQLFVELLQVGIGNRKGLSHLPSANEWASLFEMTKTQTLVPLAFNGVTKLKTRSDFGASLGIPKEIYLNWLRLTTNSVHRHKEHLEVLGRLQELLETKGIEWVLMKGLACGRRYEQPELRMCGDMDFVVKRKDFYRTLDALEEIGRVDRELVHEHHGIAYVKVDGSGHEVQLEPHYKLHNFQYGRNDRAMIRMQEWLMEHREWADIGGYKVPVMPATLESVFLVSHMVNHVYEEGLGLRQVLDYAMFISSSFNEIDRNQHDRWLKEMGMMGAHRVFVRICEKYLGVRTDIAHYEYSSAEKRFADQMMENIMRVGNFGRGAYVFDHSSRWGELKNYLWVTRRAIRLWRLCPSEALVWPVSKLLRWMKKDESKGGRMM